jgi:type I restriction enzyme M protein
MIALPGQLFYTTQIPVCLWFLTKNKKADKERGFRSRVNQTLFIDARQMGTMTSRIHKELTTEDIAEIAGTYHNWRTGKWNGEYAAQGSASVAGGRMPGATEDKAGFCKSATFDEIEANDFVLTPGRYVGAAEIEDDGIPFETKMAELSQTLYQQMDEAEKLDAVIRKNLEVLGYGR